VVTAHQQLQHPSSHARAVLHRLVGGNGYFLATALSLFPQPGLVHRQLALAQVDAAPLCPVPVDVSLFALPLRRSSSYLLCRQVQDSLDGHPAGDVDQLFHCHPGLLDQINHGQQELAVPA